MFAAGVCALIILFLKWTRLVFCRRLLSLLTAFHLLPPMALAVTSLPTPISLVSDVSLLPQRVLCFAIWLLGWSDMWMQVILWESLITSFLRKLISRRSPTLMLTRSNSSLVTPHCHRLNIPLIILRCLLKWIGFCKSGVFRIKILPQKKWIKTLKKVHKIS